MKYILSYFIVSALSIIVLKQNQCLECTALTQEQDCLAINCIWETDSVTQISSCQETQIQNQNNTTYCGLISSNCSITLGCAFIENQCQMFAGCSAYKYDTTIECQQISNMCFSYGDGCNDIQSCQSYFSQDICINTPSISGSGICVWEDDKCRDQICSEASISFITDEECQKFISGCITTGQGCTTPPLQLCSKYNSSQCSQMIGSDGNCETVSGQQNCILKTCLTASQTFSTDLECNTYLQGCITNGNGCVEILPSCTSYQQDCSNYIGSDGVCELDLITNKCRSRICENGIYNSNAECDQYKKGCLSNGVNCVLKLESCTQYIGTQITCILYIGSEGKCKGNGDLEQNCIVQDCVEDSNSLLTTDQDCQKINKNCITNGYGCVYQLQNCASYLQDEDVCQKLIGSDGKCKGGQNGNCDVRKCEDAPNTYFTNNECNNFQSNCVSNGNGCIELTTCNETLTEISCLGTSECEWNSSCIDSSDCTLFQTQTVCENNYAITSITSNGITSYNYQICKWKNNLCQNLLCSDLTLPTYNSDYSCQQMMSQCVFGGRGCVSKNSSCQELYGTQQQCSQYLIKCWNDSSAIDSTPCRSRLCSDNITFNTDGQCSAFLNGCLTNGHGCIEDTKGCSDYQGTQEQCNKFNGFIINQSNRQQCYNVISADSTTNCINKSCGQLNNATNDVDCNKFMSGCVWNGLTSCIQDSSDCSSFSGTQSQCNAFKGNKTLLNGVITYTYCYGLITNISTSACKVKECTDNQIIGLSDDQCESFLSGCLSNGYGCVEKSITCDQYIGTAISCQTFTGNGQKCTRMSDCKSRSCSDISNPSNQQDCYNYHSNCRFKNSQSPCIDSDNCNSYIAQGNNDTEKLSYCRSITDSENQQCSFANGETNCQNYTCDQIIEESECKGYIYQNRLCYFVNNECFSAKSCSEYIIDYVTTNKPVNDQQKLIWCNQMTDNNNVQCEYHNLISTSKCAYFTICEQILIATSAIDCNNQLYSDPLFNKKGCQYYNSKCYSTYESCSEYIAIGNNNSEKLSYCKSMSLNTSIGDTYSTQVIQCLYINGDLNCSSIGCEDIVSPLNQGDCDKQGVNCIYFNNSCYTKKLDCINYTANLTAEFCSFVTNDNGYNCSFIDGMTNCIDPSSDCTLYTWIANMGYPAPTPLPQNNLEKKDYCRKRRNENGRMCGYINDANSCNVETNYCEMIESPLSQNDCLIVSGCTFIQLQQKCFKTIELSSCTSILFDSNYFTSDEDKLNYCANIKLNSGICTWLNSSNTCEDLLDNCSQYDISGIDVNNKMLFCLNRFTKEGQCAWKQGDSLTSCRLQSCFDIQTPSTQANCDRVLNGCQYYKGSCILAKSNCQNYYAIGTNDLIKLAFCNGLKQTSDNSSCTFIMGQNFCTSLQSSCSNYDVSALTSTDLLNWCQVLSDSSGIACINSQNNCVTIQCELLINVTSQKSCDIQLTGCQYYDQNCYSIQQNCAQIAIPSTIENSAKFCSNLKNSNNEFCTYLSGSQCSQSLSDCSYNAEGSTETDQVNYCQERKNINGIMCTYLSDQSTCSVADNPCDLIVEASNQFDCQSSSSDCFYSNLEQICKQNLNSCEEFYFSTSDDNERLLFCQSIQCTYIYGNNSCSSIPEDCSLYQLSLINDKELYCQVRESQIGICTWSSANYSVCQNFQCSDISNPMKQSDCVIISNKCIEYIGSCYEIGTCNSYTSKGINAFDQKLYCEGLVSSNNIQCTYLQGENKCQDVTECTSYNVSSLSSDQRQSWCNLMFSQVGQCTYNIDMETCTDQNLTCDSIINIEVPLSQNQCDFYLNGQCIYYSSQCYQIMNQCNAYDAGINDQLVFCQSMKDQTGHYCSYNNGTNCSQYLVDCSEINAIGDNSEEKRQFCRKYISGDGQLCDYKIDNQCELARNYCDLINSSTSQEYCDQRMQNCVFIQSQGLCIEDYKVLQCSDLTFELSYNNKINYCQGYQKLNCTWKSATNHCEDNITQCSDFDASSESDKQNYCSQIVSISGKCAWKLGDTSNYCRQFQCQDIINPINQSDCDKIQLGCIFFINQCYTEQINCNKYYSSNDTQLSQEFCNRIITSSGEKCTYLIGQNYCQIRSDCTSYQSNDSLACQGMYDSNGNKCIYITGQYCQTKGICEEYIGNVSQCTQFLDINNRYCLQGINSCLTFTCEDIINPTDQQNCEDQLQGQCIFITSKCITLTESCNLYQVNDQNAITYCESIKNINGFYCTADQQDSSQCRERLCSDKIFYINQECSEWSKLCKSNGDKCIEVSTECSQLQGTQNYCQKQLDVDNTNKCIILDDSEQTTGQCLALSCYQDTTSQTDQECMEFQNGCLTMGVGCISDTATCDQYRGTYNSCIKFSGYLKIVNGKQIREICSADISNTEEQKCRSRICSDNITDNTNAKCQYFKTDCLTNGQGCIDKSCSCQMYSGTQSQCSKFMGTNQTIYCWNVNNATEDTPCTEKQCTDISASTDEQCLEAFPQLLIENQLLTLCVSNGNNCINNPASCNDFQGDENTCSKFTANIDGPCKSTSSGYCGPKQCYEAPITYNTDLQCQMYHSSCLTTGAGCMKYSQIANNVKQLQCSDVITQAVCALKQGCNSVGQCLKQVSQCQEVTSQSICNNTTLIDNSYCFYDQQQNICRQFQCSDQSNTISDHSVCNLFSSTCTTNGAGCIEMQTCINYKTQLICESAYSIDIVTRCSWDNNQCRVRKCSDLNGTTNVICNTFLKGCITNGSYCISSQYECSDLLEKNCLSDYQGQPCAYAESKCWNYKKCSDLPFTTHITCYSFNKFCTSNSSNCIPLNKCLNYINKESCVIGIDGQCAWRNNSCKQFISCTELQETQTQNCQSYNSVCVSDGKSCIDQTACDEYLTNYACTNNTGTDGKCIWDNNQCRLQICEDLVLLKYSFDNCKDQLNGCTFNGKQCISLQSCDKYDLNSCYLGRDGICIYRIPKNIKTENAYCDVKVCEDVIGNSVEVCQSAISGIICTSNGTNCISKQLCSQYTTKIACASGGTDGDCAFTPYSTTSVDGTCKSFNECTDANNDKIACQQKSNFCQWISTGSKRQCIAHTCLTYNSNNINCLPVPSLDGKQYTLCSKFNQICSNVALDQLNKDTCFINSQFTGYWNQQKELCESCINNNNNQTDLDNSGKTNSFNYILSGYIFGLILLI